MEVICFGCFMEARKIKYLLFLNDMQFYWARHYSYTYNNNTATYITAISKMLKLQTLITLYRCWKRLRYTTQKTYRKSTKNWKKIKKYNTFTFIIESWKIGLAVDNCKEDRKGKNTLRIIAIAESGLLSFVFSAVWVFNGHMSFTFDFISSKERNTFKQSETDFFWGIHVYDINKQWELARTCSVNDNNVRGKTHQFYN